ncbi:hypothetical protein GCM10008982_04330 [Anoxybacillus voinovskiensis]|nr:hypothetical protein GCM10008982_04330 [Anoxybacillus voinovskiensis]
MNLPKTNDNNVIKIVNKNNPKYFSLSSKMAKTRERSKVMQYVIATSLSKPTFKTPLNVEREEMIKCSDRNDMFKQKYTNNASKYGNMF